MVFLVVQIRSGPKVLKPWYGCVINESCTLCDVFTEFSGGRLDGSLPIPAEYSGTAVEAFVGAKRTELTRVSCECTVGEAITALGQYVEYTVSVMSMNVETSSNKADAMAILMKGTQERSNLPNKWRVDVPNQKLKLKNDIIDWLQTNKLGWEPSYSQQLGAAFVNALANTLWMIDGNHRTLADRGCQVPTMFEHFQGYNKPELRKKRKIDHTNLNGSEIQAHSAQYAKNVKVVLQCGECFKWRVLYSKYSLKKDQREELEQLIEDLDYTCGSIFADIEAEEDSVLNSVYVKANLTCNSTIEIPYYTAGNAPKCYHCGSEDKLQEKEKDFPICLSCLNVGKKPVPKRSK